MDIKVSGRQYKTILNFIERGDNISAIQYLRKDCGCKSLTLADVKHAVEKMAHVHGFTNETPHEDSPTISAFNLMPTYLSAVIPVRLDEEEDVVSVVLNGDGNVTFKLMEKDMKISVDVLKAVLKMTETFDSLSE